MRVYECFADDCPYTTGQRREYERHLFYIHTEGSDVHRSRTVQWIMQQQEHTDPPRPVDHAVPGGMRRTRSDYGRGDVW